MKIFIKIDEYHDSNLWHQGNIIWWIKNYSRIDDDDVSIFDRESTSSYVWMQNNFQSISKFVLYYEVCTVCVHTFLNGGDYSTFTLPRVQNYLPNSINNNNKINNN